MARKAVEDLGPIDLLVNNAGTNTPEPFVETKKETLYRYLLLKLLSFIIMKTRPCNIQRFFSALKIEKIHLKNCDIFLIFAKNIDCGYTLEPPRRGGSNVYP